MAKRSDYIGQNKNFHCLWRPTIVCFSPLCTKKLEGPSFLYMWRFFFSFHKICSVLKGGIKHLKKTCQWEPAIEHMRVKTSDRKHSFRSLCCYSRIALFPCARNTRTFPANWQVDNFTFRHLIKPLGGRKRVVKEFLTGSLPPFLALVLPHFFSRSLFFPVPNYRESLEKAIASLANQPSLYI